MIAALLVGGVVGIQVDAQEVNMDEVNNDPIPACTQEQIDEIHRSFFRLNDNAGDGELPLYEWLLDPEEAIQGSGEMGAALYTAAAARGPVEIWKYNCAYAIKLSSQFEYLAGVKSLIFQMEMLEATEEEIEVMKAELQLMEEDWLAYWREIETQYQD